MAGTRAMKAAVDGARGTRTTARGATRATARGKTTNRKKDLEFTLPGSDETLHIRATIKHDAMALLSADIAVAEDAQDDKAASIAVNAIMANVFTAESVARIKQRIVDPDDELTFKDIIAVMRQAVEDAAGRPTTSSRT